MIRLLPILLLTGCAGSALTVTELEGSCELLGNLFTPTILEQTPPESEALFEFLYEGTNCTVRVWNADMVIEE